MTKLLDELADRCEQATGRDRTLEQDIHDAIYGRDYLENRFQTDGSRIRQYTASLDAAMTLAEPFMLVALSDIAADGMTGCCLCSDTSSSPPKEHWGVPSERGGNRQSVLARAVVAASLRARSSQGAS